MTPRRFLFAAPLLALCRPAAAIPWLRDIAELRFGTPGAVAARAARTLRLRVTASPLRGPALAQALNAGHLEAALLDAPTLARAQTLMAERLILLPTTANGTPVIRRALPLAVRTQLADVLTTDT